MIIKDMFKKPIDREIQRVIIASQREDANVSQELEEYVVTKELQKHFAEVFSAYKKGIIGNTPQMGIWISGFFGSGKSHFLKILSYILSNRKVAGKYAIDYFIEDNKIIDNMVLADMKLAADTPTDVVLFNIDSKNDSNSKRNIVNVFLRVFNEMQGFSGSMPALADLERKLTEEGRYEEFKSTYEEISGDNWLETRKDFDFIQDDIVDVLVEMNFMSESAARNWCEKAIEPYSISIEDFAKRVKSYITAKGNNHHIVFLVDEIGQYIGDNSDLMLNLQTVTEELGKECMGKAWVIVTGQEDIDSITKVKSIDFSKIQGRFDTRISLSSANADAVIKKRILDKTDTASQTLKLLYEQKSTIIKNLIFFNDGVEKKLYEGERDFVEVYPFVSYQFNLLASVLTSIRKHGASGKSLSEGERSMLAMFKESAMDMMNEEIGAIVPFCTFYDALEQFLDHGHRDVIIRAYDNSAINPDKKTSNVFAINVLKTLFMIKYILECEANIENITSLMVSIIDEDRVELKDKVENALRVLSSQMLIQKNGSIYVFLTDEEQEINREIENQSVELSEKIMKASEMIFEDIFQNKNYRYPEFNGRYAFNFNQKVDDRPYKANQKYDIGVHILTPASDYGYEERVLKMMSGQGKEVLVVLPDDMAFIDEIGTYLKIEKFLRLDTSASLTKFEEIKEAKRVEMRERNANARIYLTEALKNADIYVNGDKFPLSTKEVSGRINEALGKLVNTVYHKLSYINSAKDESDIRKLFKKEGNISIDISSAEISNKHALDDVLAYIASNTRLHTKVSLKSIKDRFMKAPYGFVEADVNWLVAQLFVSGNLSFTVNGENVTLHNRSSEDIISYILRKAYVEKLMIEERVRVSDKNKNIVKKIMKEVFHYSSNSSDEDELMRRFQKDGQTMLGNLGVYLGYYNYNNKYPGKSIIEDGKKLLNLVLQIKNTIEFFETVVKYEDTFLDFSEDIEPVESFFNGEQKNIFDRAINFINKYEDSKAYIVDKNLEEIASKISSIVNMKSPYRDIHKLPELFDLFRNAYSEVLDENLGPVTERINEAKNRVIEVLDNKEYRDNKKQAYKAQFEELVNGAECCTNVSVLRSFADKAEALKIRLLNEMDKLDAELEIKKNKLKQELSSSNKDTTEPVVVAKTPNIKKKKNISIKSVTCASSWTLETKDDIDKYVESLREKLNSKLEDNTILNIEF